MALQIRTAIGKLAFLRVHELGSGFGPPSDFIDVEVVIGIHGATGGFGCTLRNDNNRFAHHGMLDVLRDAFNQDSVVEVEYTVDPGEFGKANGIILAARDTTQVCVCDAATTAHERRAVACRREVYERGAFFWRIFLSMKST